MLAQELRVARRPRAFVRVAGPDAEAYLQRMVSNDVAALAPGEACPALLLTAKARLIAPLVVLRRSEEDFLVQTEPELGERVRSELQRFRFAAKAEIEPEEHDAWVVLGGAESLDERPEGIEATEEEYERWRVRSGIPRWGRELDDRVLPAEAGLTATHVSFTKGCYPGQEPIARLHYRGHANRGLRVLRVEADELPPYDAELRLGERAVGRVTSAVRAEDGSIVALGYVRTDVPEGSELTLASGGLARA